MEYAKTSLLALTLAFASPSSFSPSPLYSANLEKILAQCEMPEKVEYNFEYFTKQVLADKWKSIKPEDRQLFVKFSSRFKNENYWKFMSIIHGNEKDYSQDLKKYIEERKIKDFDLKTLKQDEKNNLHKLYPWIDFNKDTNLAKILIYTTKEIAKAISEIPQ